MGMGTESVGCQYTLRTQAQNNLYNDLSKSSYVSQPYISQTVGLGSHQLVSFRIMHHALDRAAGRCRNVDAGKLTGLWHGPL